MAVQVTLQPVASQQVQTVLGGQQCQIAVYVKNQCMFLDMMVNGKQVIYAVQCKNLVSLIPTAYLGFVGWLMFIDTQGREDPKYTGLGSRWQLLYLTEGDLTTYGL